MRLTITTPLARVVDVSDVSYVRAEDETGAFGILPGHADFLTTLAVSVVMWRKDGNEHHVAVRGGVLTVQGGDTVSIVTRQAASEDTLERLGEAVLAGMRKDQVQEEASRLSGTRLELAAMRQIERYLATGESRLRRSFATQAGAEGQSDEFSQGSVR